MATNPNSPLNQSHLSQINNAMTAIAQAESQIVLAKQAGIDVTADEARLLTAKEKLLAIKRVYFPNAV